MKKVENTNKLLEMISILTQAEINIFFAFEAAIQSITSTKFKYTLNRIKKDHFHHFQELCTIIEELGGIPPRGTPDRTGHLLEGFTRTCGSVGMIGAFRAITSNEKIISAIYDEILKLKLPKRIKDTMLMNKKDEETHLMILEKLARIDNFKQPSFALHAS